MAGTRAVVLGHHWLNLCSNHDHMGVPAAAGSGGGKAAKGIESGLEPRHYCQD